MTMTEPMGETYLTIKRTFDADIQTVWRALTDPQAWMHWFGAKMASTNHTEADLRPGGKWAIRMTGNDSGEAHNVSGEFVEVDEPTFVSFTWAWYTTPENVSLVSYRLKADGETTTLTLTHERFANIEARDGHNRGWIATMDTLEAYLAAQA
ncbi:MAG: SRPBCC domain-containing protein [Pseudomonadota bacterium]